MRHFHLHFGTLALCLAGVASAAGGITFTDIAAGDKAGISYRRKPSLNIELREANRRRPTVEFHEFFYEPTKPRGMPGTVIWDYDRDGNLDLYVTNGPGRANSLFQSQHAQTGLLTFVDVGLSAGVDATLDDSTGACAGDIDNDGDLDLYVNTRGGPNRLFLNRQGTFTDVAPQSEAGAGTLSHVSCSMGDINGDGLLDISVVNSFEQNQSFAIFVEPFELNQTDQLLLNTDGTHFIEVSAQAGFGQVKEITWATTIVDYDQDGDADIFTASDQAAVSPAKYGGVDRGFVHAYRNDGAGNFQQVTAAANLQRVGGWMGLAWADFNCDGHLDYFATNEGDYFFRMLPFVPYSVGERTSRWMLGSASGVFRDPGVGSLVGTPFGWGASAADYDNDGDADIIYYGGLEMMFWATADNPGTILQNQGCSANFVLDTAALANSTNHRMRTVEGVAVGDLNRDGFVDIVTVASEDKPLSTPRRKFGPTGGPFDATAEWVETYEYLGPFAMPNGAFRPNPVTIGEGRLAIEVSSGNANGWVEVATLGAVGLVTGGKVNRDGVGAVVKVTPKGAASSVRPVLAGSSFASQDASAGIFGLQSAPTATVDILWPGGVRNRLYSVNSKERVRLPEIPCSYAATWPSRAAYAACVSGALSQLKAAAAISSAQATRLESSALLAYDDFRR